MGNNTQYMGAILPVTLIAIFAFVTTVFWMIVSWRAMRAHERIASTLEQNLPR